MARFPELQGKVALITGGSAGIGGQVARLLALAGGKVMMAGEPIVEGAMPLMPYPWGVRMDSENISIMRQRGWMELGFHENFLVSTFEAEGFTFRKYPLGGYHYCTIYAFERT